MKIWLKDVRATGHCVRGARQWFDDHGLDFAKFLNEGIDEKDFLATEDAIAIEIVEKLRG